MRNEMSESVVVSISRDELREEMEKAVRRGLEDVGLYTEDAEDRREAREDMRFVRRLRRATDAAAGRIGYTVLAIVTGAAMVVVWAGIKAHVLK
ncbi:cell division protein FtsX [Ancylobacter sp. 3268]|uniref:hypothetical protein n=1 Tax=Ancylobacter sp. 3268 TaxID=2817752 RepID=UPI0028558F07|nr:hypothetical protein [Ancylobacter sp. 3268]MDR6952283.1 cell division protein FtsX [Ancylobacter sp. 3268]